jgi:hypothetical protein
MDSTVEAPESKLDCTILEESAWAEAKVDEQKTVTPKRKCLITISLPPKLHPSIKAALN